MKAVWPVIFGLGIILAISGGAQMPAEGQQWPDTVPLFLVGVVVSIAGLIGWRRVRSQHAASPDSSVPGMDPFVLLETLLPPARALCDDLETSSAERLCGRVDALLEEYVHPLAEVRQGIVDQLGMEKGAEVLVVQAYGERMLNRVWSAASDGHLPEARSVYPDALQAFEEAARLARVARERGRS